MVGLSSDIGDQANRMLLLLIFVGLSGTWMDSLNAFSIHFFCFLRVKKKDLKIGTIRIL